TYYADYICIHSESKVDLQRLLNSFTASSTACGLILSPDKSRIFSPRNSGTLPECTVGYTVILPCKQYIYLATPVRQRVHPIVLNLIDQLQQLLTPLPCLTNNAAGISILVTRTVYIVYPICCRLPFSCPMSSPPKSLVPLEKFQNKVMRFILGCPTSTRIVNMQIELNLPSLNLDIYVHVAEDDHGPPPWRIPCPAVTFTHTTKADPPLLQKQLALETIDRVST
ncbi:hypothetical protein Hamer_G000428, partial [Homarus americanus]